MESPTRGPEAHPALLAGDEHDRTLLERVHPTGWSEPEPHDRYDLVVLGAGTGGLVSAAIAAGLGGRVALIERALMGGDCLNVGCVPSKALLRAARAWSEARTAKDRFGGPTVEGPGDFGAAMERMRRLRAALSPNDSAPRFRDLGVDVFLGSGRFTGEDGVEVNGRSLRFRRAILATGARPVIPDVPGLRASDPLTNETVFTLTELPPRLLIVGGGPIGCELAQAFARFGSAVTLVEAAPRLLPRDDPDAARIVKAALEKDGVEVRLGARVVRVASDEGVHRAEVRVEGGAGRSGEVEAERILVATGRAPNVEEIGLEAAGIRSGARGVETDDRLRTTNSRVFAVGDVNGRFQFTHAADAQARIAVQNALFFGRKKASALVIPWCTYTSPEVAQVGIGGEEAARRESEVETITIPLAEVDRARLDGEEEGFLRVHLRAGSDQILGATVVAEHAGELIAPLTAAITAGLGLDRLGSTILPYPTVAEAVRRAADGHRRKRLTPTVRRGFELFLRTLR
jgi:pyruvate/2-oxoglutarate dehydrogenase complex dihydrolipoamide dehydrogenase (E3) component